MRKIFLSLLLVGSFSCQSTAQPQKELKTYMVEKTDAEWQEQLSDLSYYVCLLYTSDAADE